MKNLGFCMRAYCVQTKNHTACMEATKNHFWTRPIPCFMHFANQTHDCMHGNNSTLLFAFSL